MNDNKIYQVIFKGDVLDGKDIAEVKKKLAIFLKKDSSVIDNFFRGGEQIIKQAADFEVCKKVKEIFEKAGAECILEQLPESYQKSDLADADLTNNEKEQEASEVIMESTSESESGKEARIEELEKKIKEKEKKLKTAEIKKAPPQVANQLPPLKATSQTSRYVSSYEAARTLARLISSMGWVFASIAVIMIMGTLFEGLSSRYGVNYLRLFMNLLPFLGALLGGLTVVALGQITRAIVDTADYNKEMLEVMKEMLNRNKH